LFAPHLGRLIARFDARRRRAKGVFGGMAKLDLGGELSRGQNFRLYRAAAKHDGTPVELMQVVKPSRKHVKAIEQIGYLHHPNLVKHLTWYMEDRMLHMLREEHGSGNLSTMIKHFKKARKAIPEGSIWKYVTAVCTGLSYMHDHKIAHRDVRPGTVCVTRDGAVKVSIEPFANLHLAVDPWRHGGMLHYMCPERVRGDVHDHFKSDIWSLGCLIFEMAELVSPFHIPAQSIYALATSIQTGAPSVMVSSRSAAFQGIVRRCLSLDPRDRPDIRQVLDVAMQQSNRYGSAAAAAAAAVVERAPKSPAFRATSTKLSRLSPSTSSPAPSPNPATDYCILSDARSTGPSDLPVNRAILGQLLRPLPQQCR